MYISFIIKSFLSLYILIFNINYSQSTRILNDIRLTPLDIINPSLLNGLNKLDTVGNLIHQRFEFHDKNKFQFFLGSQNMPSYAWDILKYKFAKKIVDGNSTFLMIFGGSSVTAGHDNYLHQAYPQVYERRMKPVFEALGINLLVHNIAQGANNCRPSNLCYDSMGGMEGMDADWIGWEQSFNCGRAADIFELVARTAYFNKAVVYYSASGAFAPSDCAMSSDPIPWISEEWTPSSANITTKFSFNKTYLKEYREELDEWYEDGNSVERFISPLRNLYKGTGHHGFSVWGHSRSKCNNNGTKGCTAIEMRGPCYESGGSHWLTKEASIFGCESGKGASWHPPAGMHLLRGEVIAYNHASIIADAIIMVQSDLATKSKQEASKEYQNQLDILQEPIPTAEECSTQCHCRSECETKPVCFTNYKPHFNKLQTLDSVIIGNHSGWNHVDKPGVGKEADKYGYLDRRPCLEARGSGVEIFVKMEIKNSTFAKVCGYSQKESLKHALFYIDKNIDNPGDDYSPVNKTQIHTRKYFGDECTLLTDLPRGKHVLIIATHPEHANHVTSFSHLITFL